MRWDWPVDVTYYEARVRARAATARGDGRWVLK